MQGKGDVEKLKKNHSNIAVNGGILWLRIGGKLVATILTTRFLIEALGVEIFGVYAVTISLGLSFGFLTGSLQTTSLRAIAMSCVSRESTVTVFNALLGLHLWTSISLIVLGLIFGSWMIESVLNIPTDLRSSALTALVVIVLSSAGTTFLSPYEAFLQAKEKFGVFSIIDVLRGWLLVPLALWVGTYEGDRLIAYTLIASSFNLILFCSASLFVISKYPEVRPRLKLFIDFGIYRTQVSLFSWTLVGALSAVATTQGVPILVNIIGGPVASAAFAVAKQLQSVLRQLASSISVALIPRVYSNHAGGDTKQMLGIALTSCRLSTLIIVSLATPLMFEVTIILKLWLGEGIPYATNYVVFLCVTLLVNHVTLAVGNAQMAIGRIARYQLTVGLIMICFLPAGYLLGVSTGRVDYMLYTLIAFSALASFARVQLIELIIPGASKRWYKETLVPVSVCAIFIVLLGFGASLTMPSSPLRLFLTAIIVGGGGGLALIFFGLQPSERSFLLKMFGRRSDIK